MHSKECSRIDNNDKVPAIVDLGVCPNSGAKIYDLHERRELVFDDNEILDELTGRNRMDKNKPNPPHPVWLEILQSTKTLSRPEGIRGSTKLIRKCKCPCMKKVVASVCSCSICERFKDALRRFHKYQVGWRLQAMERRKKDFIELKRTEGWTDEAINTFISTNVDDFSAKGAMDNVIQSLFIRLSRHLRLHV
jgi:hypothetical protein